MSAYWVNFARTGDPNGPGLPGWPEFTPEKEQVMRLAADCGPQPTPNRQKLEALDAYYAWRRAEARKRQ